MKPVLPLAVLAMITACGDGTSHEPGPPDAVTGTPTTLAWTIKRSGVTTTCTGVHADEVRVLATSESGAMTNMTFQCVLSPGMLTLPAGRYAITADLYDGTGPQKLATQAPEAVTVPSSATIQLVFNL